MTKTTLLAIIAPKSVTQVIENTVHQSIAIIWPYFMFGGFTFDFD